MQLKQMEGRETDILFYDYLKNGNPYVTTMA